MRYTFEHTKQVFLPRYFMPKIFVYIWRPVEVVFWTWRMYDGIATINGKGVFKIEVVAHDSVLA